MNLVPPKKREFDDTPNRFEAVLPTDLFSIFVPAAMVTDRHFQYAKLCPGNSRGQFRLDAKSFALKSRADMLDDLEAECFVACLHVSQLQIGEGVGNCR